MTSNASICERGHTRPTGSAGSLPADEPMNNAQHLPLRDNMKMMKRSYTRLPRVLFSVIFVISLAAGYGCDRDEPAPMKPLPNELDSCLEVVEQIESLPIDQRQPQLVEACVSKLSKPECIEATDDFDGIERCAEVYCPQLDAPGPALCIGEDEDFMAPALFFYSVLQHDFDIPDLPQWLTDQLSVIGELPPMDRQRKLATLTLELRDAEDMSPAQRQGLAIAMMVANFAFPVDLSSDIDSDL